MHETSKAVQRRLHDSNFLSRYFVGNGIDIGAGNDALGQYIELFPLMSSCLSFDREDGDAQEMAACKNEQYDFVHSSHCLEHVIHPDVALKSWFRILKPGGHLIVLVPDEDMYEQGIFPSTFNSDHKHTFTTFKAKSWTDKSWNLLSLIADISPDAELIKIEKLTGTFRFGLDRQDQTLSPIGEAAIEFIIRKREDRSDRQPARVLGSGANRITDRPKIALHRPGAIGDIIMTLSLVPLLKQKYPDHDIHYFCHPLIGRQLTWLMRAAGIDHGFDSGLFDEKQHEYAQAFNLIGYPLHEGYPEKPMKKHLIEYFANEMGMTASYELPHLTLDMPPPHTEKPLRYATIHPKAGWSSYKNWPHARWEEVMAEFPDIVFYQIGAENDPKLHGAEHYAMGKPLDVSIDLMAHADLHLGIDSWTNHLTNIKWKPSGFTPAIILWGSTQASAAGYSRNTNISLGLQCQPCFREDPAISRMPRGPCINPPGQVYEHPRHACMINISVDRVVKEIEAQWSNGQRAKIDL
jgi:ADP-heptose:LPS heptosyltransferase/SAM-dependent methyltransferase